MKNIFNHKNLAPNQYRDTLWVRNELNVHNLHFRRGFCANLAKICGCNSQKSRKYTKTTFNKISEINHKLFTSSEG